MLHFGWEYSGFLKPVRRVCGVDSKFVTEVKACLSWKPLGGALVNLDSC